MCSSISLSTRPNTLLPSHSAPAASASTGGASLGSCPYATKAITTIEKSNAPRAIPTKRSRSLLLVSGVTYFAYVQLAWVCLSRMSAVSHSLVNSLRRPATILAALFYAPMKLSALNIGGIVLACASALLYGVI